MISIDKAIIVEGKYDKITLARFIDATIIPTNGFSVFKDREKRKLISILAEKKGLVIITDSDSAGAMIRTHIKKICKSDNIINVYVPQICGKERRKLNYSKEGFLGVEGLSEEIITDALKKSGVLDIKPQKAKVLNKQDLFVAGLSGKNDSKKSRESFAAFSGLPKGMSSSAFLDAVNAIYDYEDFWMAVEKWQSEEGKS